MRSFLGIGLVVAVMAVGVTEAQEGLTKQNRQGPVTVAVTLTAVPAVGEPVKIKVVLDTHSVGLDGIAFDQAVAMRTADGSDIPPTTVEQVRGSGHHREAVLIFPPLGQGGAARVVVRNVGGVAERSFAWELPAR